MSEVAGFFLKRIHEASNMLHLRKQEPYTLPSPEQIKSSLNAMNDLLDNTSKNTDAKIAMTTSKWFEMMARGDAEKRVALANDLYILAAGRNADLELEAPEIVAAIRYEYRPMDETETMIRETRAPIELLQIGIQAKLESLKQQPK